MMTTGLTTMSRGRIIGVSAAISLVTLIALLLYSDLAVLRGIFLQADVYYFLLCVAAYLAIVFFRTCRLWVLLPAEYRTSLASCFQLILGHQMIFAIAPGGLGDLAFPAMAKVQLKIGWQEALNNLLTVRIQDFLFLSVIAGVSAVIMLAATGATVSLILIISGCIICILISTLTPVASMLLNTVIPWVQNKSHQIRAKFHLPVDAPDNTFVSINHISATARALSMGLTVMSWFAAALMLWMAFLTFGFEIAEFHVLILLLGLNLIGAAAIFTIGGMGIAEAGLAGLLVALGYDKSTAIPVAMLVRPMILFITLGFGGGYIPRLLTLTKPPDRNPE